MYGHGDNEVRALDGVTVEFEQGRFTAIMGPSGSGKSTLMHCVAGLDSLSSGSVTIGEHELTSMSDGDLTRLRRTQVGFIFQAFNLIPTLSALENIVLPLSLAGQDGDQQWIDQVIDTIGLRDRLGHRPSELSGGQQQRVAVARALVTQPALLLADEPTGNLDTATTIEVMALFQELHAAGATLIIVTHEAEVAACCTRTLVLRDGLLVSDRRHAALPAQPAP